MLPGCCPACGFAGEIEAFLVEPEAKRAIARVAALEPAVGKLIGPYLRLFGSGKRGLQLRRAVKLIDELTALIEPGRVARDERTGVRRPATPAMWAAGIEQMLANPPSGPVQNHNYLRAIVFGLADAADAQAERAREEAARTGRRNPAAPATPQDTPEQNAIRYADHMHNLGVWDKAQRDAYIANARNKAKEAP